MRPAAGPPLFIAACVAASAVFFALLPFREMGAGAHSTIPGIVTVSVASAFQLFLALLILCVWLFFRRDRLILCLACVCFSGGALEAFNLLCEIGPGASLPSVRPFYSAGYGVSANLMVFFIGLYFHLYVERATRERGGALAGDRALRLLGRAVAALLVCLVVTLPIIQTLYHGFGFTQTGWLDAFKRCLCALVVGLTLLRVCRAFLLRPDPALRPAVASAVVYGAGGVRDLVSFTAGPGLRLHGVATGSALMGLILFVGIAMEYAAAQRKLRSWSTELEEAVDARTRELARSNEKLRELEERRREMVANVAHDLRAPIAAISGAIRLLENAPGGNDNAPLVEMAAERSRQLTGQVRDLFDLTRLETGEVTLSKASVSARELLQDFFRHYETELAQSGSSAKPSLVLPERDDDMEVEADFERLWQVFDNLVSNALKYAGEAPELRFALRRAGDEAVFSVEDNGCGIDPADLPHVFERLHTTGGTGLGLAIAGALIELHGGRIWAESAPGRGSRFSFALPVSNTKL